MRVLYVAPRYHTNQVPVMKGWLCNGHQIMFISQFAGTSEDYTVMKPVILGYSKVFECFIQLYRSLFCRKEKNVTKEFNLRTKIGFPPLGKAEKYIRTFDPDLVIVRERAVYNLPFIHACKKSKISCMLYNQSPLWVRPQDGSSLRKKLLRSLFPPFRITPVFGNKDQKSVKDAGAFYVPFIIEPDLSPEEKEHFLNARINLLCVARYEERKNLFYWRMYSKTYITSTIFI